MSGLIKYDQARQALAACRNVDDIKDIRDKSEAMRLYAKQANDTELEQWAAEIKLRAQRAIGEISADLEKQKNQAALPSGGKSKGETLKEAGISTSTANRYEKLATIPLADVEALIAKHKDAGKPVSAKAVLATLAKPAPAPAAPPAAADIGIAISPPGFAPAVEPAAESDLDDLVDDTPDFMELLRIEEEKVRTLTEQIDGLNKEIERLRTADHAAEAEDWHYKFDQLTNRNMDLQGKVAKSEGEVRDLKKELAKIQKLIGAKTIWDVAPTLVAERISK